jgi:hypothetical protein
LNQWTMPWHVFLLTEEHSLKEYNEFASLLQTKYQTKLRYAIYVELDTMNFIKCW